MCYNCRSAHQSGQALRQACARYASLQGFLRDACRSQHLPSNHLRNVHSHGVALIPTNTTTPAIRSKTQDRRVHDILPHTPYMSPVIHSTCPAIDAQHAVMWLSSQFTPPGSSPELCARVAPATHTHTHTHGMQTAQCGVHYHHVAKCNHKEAFITWKASPWCNLHCATCGADITTNFLFLQPIAWCQFQCASFSCSPWYNFQCATCSADWITTFLQFLPRCS